MGGQPYFFGEKCFYGTPYPPWRRENSFFTPKCVQWMNPNPNIHTMPIPMADYAQASLS